MLSLIRRKVAVFSSSSPSASEGSLKALWIYFLASSKDVVMISGLPFTIGEAQNTQDFFALL